MIKIIDNAYPIFEYIEKIIARNTNLMEDNDSYNHLGSLNGTTRKMQEIKDGKLKIWFQTKAQEYLESFGREYKFSTEQRYAVCDSLFHFHYDVGDDLSRHFDDAGAMFSMVLYLNDNSSGHTYFPIQNIRVEPRKNRLAIFPASIYGAHESEEILSGYKDILACFIRVEMDKIKVQENYFNLLKEA